MRMLLLLVSWPGTSRRRDPIAAAGPRPGGPRRVKEMAGHVESARLRRTVERLAGFGTRHSLSITNSETRGIGAARKWLVGETRNLAHAARVPG